jgi:hypothetical protein
MSVVDVELMLIGRQFVLPGGGWLVLGRDEKENIRLAELRESCDFHILIEERPGPESLLRRGAELYTEKSEKDSDIAHAAALVARYAKKIDGIPAGGTIRISEGGGSYYEMFSEPLPDEEFADWLM